MSKLKELIESYAVDVKFPDVSGLEILYPFDLEMTLRAARKSPRRGAEVAERAQSFLQSFSAGSAALWGLQPKSQAALKEG